MFRVVKIIIVPVFCLLSKVLFAYESGAIIKFNVDINLDSNAELTVIYYDRFISPLKNYNSEKFAFEKDGRTLKVVIKMVSNYGYIQFENLSFLGVLIPNNYFLIERGDSIEINVQKDHIVGLSGKNIDKWKYQFDLSENCFFPPKKTISDSDEIKKLKEDSDSLQKSWMKNLFLYKRKLSPTTYELLHINTITKIKFGFVSHLWISIRRYDENGLQTANEILEELYNKRGNLNSTLIVQNALYYIDYLFALLHAREVISNKIKNREKPLITDNLYYSIKCSFTGTLRDNILALYFMKIDRENVLKNLPDALKIVSDAWSKKIIQSINMAKGPRALAYQFELPDTNNVIHRLSDFNGKVVVCKFWFKGCFGCIRLSYDMEPIVERFHSDSNIIFVSINVDSDRSKWKAGLLANNVYFDKKEKYTSKNDLNLSTLGFRHPLLQYYNLFSFPQLLIIDKGGRVVFSGTPRLGQKNDFNALIDLIGNELKREKKLNGSLTTVFNSDTILESNIK